MGTPDGHSDRQLRARLDEMNNRLESTQEEIEQLRNTIDAVAEQAGVSIGPVCECHRSRLVVTSGEAYCPVCDRRQLVDEQ